ncbi:MAG TPA: hypothetical protein VMH04_02500 [Candidatus Solibacter sp.]|nr:hypothetical protein [Candidatus Solibacter sp.]
MYTGTLIAELMRTVQRAEEKAQQSTFDRELHEIFAMQIPISDSDQLLMGAA